MKRTMNINDMLSPVSGEVNIIPILQSGDLSEVKTEDLPDSLPILALRNAVLFPDTVYPIQIGREKSIRLIEDSEKHELLVGAVPQLDANVEEPHVEDLNKIGCVAKIIKTLEMPDGTMTAILHGFKRFRIDEVTEYEPYILARVTYLEDNVPLKNDNRVRMMGETLKEKAISVLKMTSFTPKEAVIALKSIDSFEFLVNFIATTIPIENFEEKIYLLDIGDVRERAMKLLSILDRQIGLLKIKQDINQKVKSEIDQQQREYYLNNQLRTIQEELGLDDMGEIEKLRSQGEKKNWSEEVKKAFEKELARLERFNPSSPDYSIQLNYIQFMLDLPWDDCSKDNLDIKHAQKVLDKDHYGLEKVKERIIEHIAVMKLAGNSKEYKHTTILCLYGPPGVGKTSLGKSIARALGRKYARISLGGMHDESEIRGHRKTYVGALPGRILSSISRAGTSNPVIVLDEIDKLCSDYKGDPSSALLEVLDPEQNVTFHDNYLDKDYDLSRVLFITTANDISTIPSALRDRMEMIQVTGYLPEEKYAIAKSFLIPKTIKANGLGTRGKGSLKFAKEAVMAIISDYTSESGVRGLEKQIAKIVRVTAKKIALGEEIPEKIKPTDLKEYLGLPISNHDKQAGNEEPGVVTGLAWTSVGGEILFIESSVSEGKGNLTMTGNLGDVMKESAQISYQYIKAHPYIASMTTEEFMKKDIHVHVPEGAVPKDGPSAGITMVTSMASAFRGEKIRSGVAMTGEMTLRGRVLPVGGIKEKILAAKRAGVKTIVISEDNRRDVEDINSIYTEGLEFHYVKTINDVINYVF